MPTNSLPAVPTLAFRTATPADVDAIVALVESAYRGDASRLGWTTEADFLDGRRTGADDVLTQIERPQSRMLLAEQSGILLACAHVAIDTLTHHETVGQAVPQAGSAIDPVTTETRTAYFGMFSVRPGLQNAGIGKAVLAEAERIACDEWQLSTMQMTVIDIRTELIAWYERRGYRRTGITKPFPYGDARFGLPKRNDLRFEILEKTL